MPSTMDATPIPLTQKALDDKKAELARLLSLREQVVKRLATAREMGDLSENGAYTAAKFELGSVGRQLRAVRHILKYGFVPKFEAGNKADEASFGKKVVLRGKDKILSFQLVSQYESNLATNKLSMESPIGRAIFGKKVGDKVLVKAPAGEVEYEILEIS